MSDNMRVTVAREEDIDSIVPLFNGYRIFYGQESDTAKAKDFLQERLKNKDSVILLALCNGASVGFIQLYPSFSSVSMKRLWILNDLYVKEDMRKKGIGRILMNAARDFAEKTKSKGLVLSTATDNLFAQKLYESVGYSKDTKFYHYQCFLI